MQAEKPNGGAQDPQAEVRDWIEENPQKVQQADIIVGIPSFNEADCIPFVTEQAAIGLKTYFKDYHSVLINCDNHSEDQTGQAFLSVETDIPRIYLSTPAGVKGKGNNFRILFWDRYGHPENYFTRVGDVASEMMVALWWFDPEKIERLEKVFDKEAIPQRGDVLSPWAKDDE